MQPHVSLFCQKAVKKFLKRTQIDQRRVTDQPYQLFTSFENVVSILAISQITFRTQSIVLQTALKN